MSPIHTHGLKFKWRVSENFAYLGGNGSRCQGLYVCLRPRDILCALMFGRYCTHIYVHAYVCFFGGRFGAKRLMAEEPTVSKKRLRFQAVDDAAMLPLTGVLPQYFTLPTKVIYEEKRGRSRSDVHKLRQHATLLLALKRTQGNCAFSQATMQQCLATVGDARKDDWKFSKEDVEDWSTRVAQRIRCMCGHFAAALKKNTVRSGARTSWRPAVAC